MHCPPKSLVCIDCCLYLFTLEPLLLLDGEENGFTRRLLRSMTVNKLVQLCSTLYSISGELSLVFISSTGSRVPLSLKSQTLEHYGVDSDGVIHIFSFH